MRQILTLLILLISTTFLGVAQDSTDVNYTVFFYESGVKSSEGLLVEGKPEGEWKTYYENGNIKSVGSRLDHLLSGKWEFYRENGKIERVINYLNDRKEGEERTFNSEGILLESFTNVNGIVEGVVNYYYLDGSLWKEIEFSGGKENGKGKEYGTDGRIISFLSYKDGFLRTQEKVNRYSASGKKTGRWIEYFPGTLKIKEEGNYTGGQKNGLFKVYNRRGDLERIETYKKGKLIVEEESNLRNVKKELGTDGKVKSVGSYSNGKKQGIFREYDSEGNVINSAVFQDDIKIAEGIIDGAGGYEGVWKLFYPSGEIKAEGEYKNGEKDGTWKYYFLNGELEQQGKYKKGLPSGDWKWYFENKKLKREEYYRKGKEDGESVEYDVEGKVINKGNYVDGLRTGDWFLTIGDYEEKGEFIDDERTGKWKSFYKKTDEIYFEGEYIQGIPIKKHVFYYPNGIRKEEGKFEGGERHGDWKYYRTDGTIRLVIRYNNGIQVRLNGEKL